MSRLIVEGVFAQYGGTQILHDVTFPKLPDGQVLGLLGPNASGKSTMIRRLSRQMAGAGRILVDQVEQQTFAHDVWQGLVATVPQTAPAPTTLMPTELMWSTARALGFQLSDAQLALKIEAIFDQVGLAEFAFSPINALSGGKRQLLGLALALIRDPEVLLLDEPTSALDLYWRMVVLDLVRERVDQQGGVAVVALHDLDLAARYCDFIVILNHGRVAASGTVQETLTPEVLAEVYHVEAEITEHANRPEIRVLRPLLNNPTHV